MAVEDSPRKSPRETPKGEEAQGIEFGEAPAPSPVPHRRSQAPQYYGDDDLVARVRAARAEYQRKLEEFGDVSEYKISKIYGQRTDIRYDDEVKKEDPPAPTSPQARQSVPVERSRGNVSKSDPGQESFEFEAEDTLSKREER